MKKHPLLCYFILTYAITWGLAASFLFFPAPIEAVFGELSVYNPLYFLAVYAPSLSALIVVWRKYGISGCKEILKRVIGWKKGVPWFFTLILFFAGYYLIMRNVSPAWNAEIPVVPYKWYMLLPMAIFFLLADAGPIGEELGWSGLALPLLQRRFNSVSAALILGIIWALWHTPAFFFASLNQSAYNFFGFLFYLTCLRVFMVAVFNASGGSVMAVIVIHWLNNLGTYLHLTGSDVVSSLITGLIYLSAAAIVFVTVKPERFKDPIPSWNGGYVTDASREGGRGK